jgi:hypothetical protein
MTEERDQPASDPQSYMAHVMKPDGKLRPAGVTMKWFGMIEAVRLVFWPVTKEQFLHIVTITLNDAARSLGVKEGAALTAHCCKTTLAMFKAGGDRLHNGPALAALIESSVMDVLRDGFPGDGGGDLEVRVEDLEAERKAHEGA